MPKQLTCPAAGPVTFVVTAGYLDLDVTVDPAARAATAEMTGPPEVLERATAALNRIGGDTWQLSIPQDTRIRGAGIHINGRNTVVTGGGRGSIFMSGSGRIVVNGVDVTDIVSAGPPEDLKVRARLPQGSSLIARVDSGNVAARGTLAGFQLDTTSADAEIQAATVVQARSVSGDISAGCVQGPAELSAVSGDIEITDARGAVRAGSTSGDIRIPVTQPVHVDARSVSGDVLVSAAPGTRPQVSGRSVSGRVRTPAA